MDKRLLVTGLCTLHWGRLQYGNIGNYYIIEPMFRLLHKYFPEYEICTTFQMDNIFAEKEKITVLPMEIYYGWNDEDVSNALLDVECAQGKCDQDTEYVSLIKTCDLIIDVSGDMWGDNAEHVGAERFYVDCLKMKTAQLIGKKTVLYAVTPGPFEKVRDEKLATEVFKSFNQVIIREKVSFLNLKQWGFDCDNVIYAPCPSVLFESNASYNSKWIKKIEQFHKGGEHVIGLTFGGFNMPVGPYDMWPREDSQYSEFVCVINHIVNDMGENIVIFSHTNGFELPPKFKLINGRDYVILNKLYEILIDKYGEQIREKVIIIDEPLLPKDIKKVISKLDLLITGRVHASVAACSQNVPTVFIEYDRNVIYSDKMYGFSSQFGMEEFVCLPGNAAAISKKVEECLKNRNAIIEKLKVNNIKIKQLAEDVYKGMRELVYDC